MKIQPITPQEVQQIRDEEFPEFVIQGVNNAIKKHYVGDDSFTVKQKDIVKEILAIAPKGTTSNKLFDKHWMDFEHLFEAVGWAVTYDSPSRDDSFDEYYKFQIKVKK